jgi:hypothetical protein
VRRCQGKRRSLYAIYEAGIPPEDNIRVDLLLIYPVLAIDFLFWPVLLVRYLINCGA